MGFIAVLGFIFGILALLAVTLGVIYGMFMSFKILFGK